MGNAKDIFKLHLAQTFSFPSCLEVESAKGSYITDVNGKDYLDFVAGISACTLGHSNPIITNSIKEQLEKLNLEISNQYNELDKFPYHHLMY